MQSNPIKCTPATTTIRRRRRRRRQRDARYNPTDDDARVAAQSGRYIFTTIRGYAAAFTTAQRQRDAVCLLECIVIHMLTRSIENCTTTNTKIQTRAAANVARFYAIYHGKYPCDGKWTRSRPRFVYN